MLSTLFSSQSHVRDYGEMDKDIAVEELPQQVSKGAGNDVFHEDREIGPEAVDIERIEKVYR
jgi:hypothetical protein